MLSKHLLALVSTCLISCTPEPSVPPKGVVIVVDYGDITKVYIRNDGVECWIYEGGELIKKERY